MFSPSATIVPLPTRLRKGFEVVTSHPKFDPGCTTGDMRQQTKAPLQQRSPQEEDADHGQGSISGPTQLAAPSRRDSHVVHLSAPCRRTMPPLTGRHRLAAVQG